MKQCLSNQGSPLPAMDGLGRILPHFEKVGPSRKDKFVLRTISMVFTNASCTDRRGKEIFAANLSVTIEKLQ